MIAGGMATSGALECVVVHQGYGAVESVHVVLMEEAGEGFSEVVRSEGVFPYSPQGVYGDWSSPLPKILPIPAELAGEAIAEAGVAIMAPEIMMSAMPIMIMPVFI